VIEFLGRTECVVDAQTGDIIKARACGDPDARPRHP
jgi:hypothetical protein